MSEQVNIETRAVHMMLQNMKHPLTNILLSAEILQDAGLEDAEKKHLLEIVINNCGSLKDEIIDLCNFLQVGNASSQDTSALLQQHPIK